MITTIQIDKSLKEKLESLKVHHRETFNELISRLLDNCSLDSASRESLIATLEIMQDPETMRDIKESLEEYERGEGSTLEEVKKELGI